MAANGKFFSLNTLGILFRDNPDDLSQLMQLIGYSVSSYCDLSFVPDADKNAAKEAAKRFLAGSEKEPI